MVMACAGGVYKYDGRSRYMGGHSVAVVGYDDEQQAWVAVNSWGTRWGDQGYFLVSYDNPGAWFRPHARGCVTGVSKGAT